jgi:hypothetical protein
VGRHKQGNPGTWGSGVLISLACQAAVLLPFLLAARSNEPFQLVAALWGLLHWFLIVPIAFALHKRDRHQTFSGLLTISFLALVVSAIWASVLSFGSPLAWISTLLWTA